MKLSTNLTKSEVNSVKTYIMNSFRYCKRISDNIDTMEQFETFIKLCQIHINNCNYLCNKTKPKIGIIQRHKKQIYDNLHNLCNYTVEELNDIINIYNESFAKTREDAEMRMQLELSARINNEITLEYRERELKKIKETRIPIGFKINYDNNDNTKNSGEQETNTVVFD